MIKDIVQLEITFEEKTGRFQVENGTSIVIVKEMLFQFLKYIGQIEDNIKVQQEAQQQNAAESTPPHCDKSKVEPMESV